MSVMVREAAKSRLIERLKAISRGAPAPIGFGRTKEATVPALLLVAVLPRNDATLAGAAARAGVDAVALRINGAATDLLQETGDLSAEVQRIKDAIAEVGDAAIVGLIIGSNGRVSPEDVRESESTGVDFVAAYPQFTPANFLELSEVGRLAIIDQHGAQLARGINDLPIQSALVRIGRPAESPPQMTVLDVALCRGAADGIHRPIIAFPSWKLSPADLEVLRDAGVEGVALVGPEPDADAAAVTESVTIYRDKVVQLGKPKGRQVALTNVPVVLPRAASSGGGEDEDDEEDEDE